MPHDDRPYHDKHGSDWHQTDAQTGTKVPRLAPSPVALPHPHHLQTLQPPTQSCSVSQMPSPRLVPDENIYSVLLGVRLWSRSWWHNREQGSPFLPDGVHSLSGKTDNNQIITRNQCKVTTVIKCGEREVREATEGQIRE